MTLKTLALRLLGAALASPVGGALIKRYAFRTPARHLRDSDGGLYMGRWHVVKEDSLGGRILQALTGYSSVRLHRIMRADHDRELHNHPFSYRTFVLDGYYTDRHSRGLSGWPHWRLSVRGDTVVAGTWDFHRISDVSGGGVWTLFFMTRNTGEWSFNVGGKLVSSTEYLLRTGGPQ